ncbi:hypothetical protein [Spirulina subsalsa]|uniref:hypothetical protein n=1 Tax=Spirulina subsalsa TaxID=54311 RepID=UPI002237C9E2|nr:hypothetical protein [Spirulina subsalsa]
MLDVTQTLASSDYSDRLNLPGMSERRAEIIVLGAMILTEAMEMVEIPASRWGVDTPRPKGTRILGSQTRHNLAGLLQPG